jgi:hypothetical protein
MKNLFSPSRATGARASRIRLWLRWDAEIAETAELLVNSCNYSARFK